MATAGLFSMLGGGADDAAMQRQLDEQRAQAFAQQTQEQRFANMGYSAGAGLGRGIAGAFGVDVTDPTIRQAAQLRRMASEFDTTTSEGMMKFAQAIRTINPDAANQAAQQALSMREQNAKTTKAEMSIAQEEALRKELANLGPNATEADILKAVTKYGSADKVLATLQASSDKAAQRQQQVELQKERIQAQIEAARERGATQQQIAQMQIEGRTQLAQLAASLKGPSPAVIKAQERADKIAEGKAGLGDTVSVAKTLVNDIADMGGMTTTSKGALANLMTSLGTGTVGQAGARLVGTATQAKRDELNSVRLQLFNSVKEATGMSASQLNSNVELQTWLKSLGSDNMSKEANLAILNNIENRYLKNTAQKTTGTGTPENPIVLK